MGNAAVEGNTQKVLDEAKLRAGGCFLCKWIAQDLERNGRLTRHPVYWYGDNIFPVSGKLEHLVLEGILMKGEKVDGHPAVS